MSHTYTIIPNIWLKIKKIKKCLCMFATFLLCICYIETYHAGGCIQLPQYQLRQPKHQLYLIAQVRHPGENKPCGLYEFP